MKSIGNHTELLKLDLQFFAEGEEDFFFPEETIEPQDDSFLPDDFEMEEQPQGETQEQTESGEETNQTDEVSEPVEKPQMVPLKYNHEVKEVPLDEAIQLAQMGMNYSKLQERLNDLQTDPRLSFVEEIANENGMTVEQYLQAVKEQREQQRLDELIQKNIPEDLAKEILDNRKFREEVKNKEKASQEEQQKKQWEQNNQQMFKEAFPDVKQEDLPQDVLDKYNQGLPLKYAYMEHAYNQAVQKLKIYEQNKANNEKAPVGSVTAHGGQEVAPEDDFLRGFNSI